MGVDVQKCSVYSNTYSYYFAVILSSLMLSDGRTNKIY